MIKELPIGVENFIEADRLYYVDKTLIIKEIVDSCFGRPLLITRPRRFGKSLTISMIDYFFNNKFDTFENFNNKKILNIDGDYKNHLNQYPLIHLNLKNISTPKYDVMMHQMIDLISRLYQDNLFLLEDDTITDNDKEKFNNVLNRTYDEPLMYVDSVYFLSSLLNKYFSKKVIILFDEYDTPLDNAFQNGFYDEAIEFFKRFYSSSLKANDNVLFSITTGVLQISKESIFSELNNLNVFSVVDEGLMEYFGFTRNEVEELLNHYNVDASIDQLSDYYGGYGVKDTEIFNPWSILCFIEKEVFDLYWVNTGSYLTLSTVIKLTTENINTIYEFVNNEYKTIKLNNSVSYRDLANPNALFSLLVQGGYLVAKRIDNNNIFNLMIPNKEIEQVYENEIIARNLNDDNLDLAINFKNALLKGDTELISKSLTNFINSTFSYYDLRDEKGYQIFVGTLLRTLFTNYHVKSEVNNKFGRCDIMLLPKNKNLTGIVIEIKFYKGRILASRLEEYANKAMHQIIENQYYDELERMGCKSIYLYGFAFDEFKSKVSFLEK